jgi:RsiW-degrading membrane proteinase PrsW (M82 family)
MAVIFESIVSTVAWFVFLIVFSVVIASDNGLEKELSSDPKKGMKDMAVNHPGVFIFMQFVNAFFVAALVEEMIKYFSYRMVVTPDLIPPRASSSNTGEGDRVYGGSGGARSTGSAITVAVSLC